MTNVTQMAETGKNIFCPIDLHQRKMLVGIAVDRSRPSFHEFDTEWDGGVEKLINVLHGLGDRHRQPGQGRLRRRGPVHEPDAGNRGNRGADGGLAHAVRFKRQDAKNAKLLMRAEITLRLH